MELLRNIMQDFRITAEDVTGIEEQLFFDGPNRRIDIERFGMLMFFAISIAAFGLMADSAATVIGAMLIAPLMTPILATAAAVVTGQMSRAAQSLLVTMGGVLGAIGLAWLIGAIFGSNAIVIDTNQQIASRTAPRLIDLFAALTAGAVGAFAVSRKDIANTLPGAAIAIALAPPLGVVGLTLAQGAWVQTLGALLLFLTNFFAILVAGSAMLALLGMSAAATSQLYGQARRRAIWLIAGGTLLVVIPLAMTSYTVTITTQMQQETTALARRWVAETDYQVESVVAALDSILITVSGEGEPPPPAELVNTLDMRFQREITVQVKVIPARQFEFSTLPARASR
ncbi:MAG: DUF389 domain-containing protein [Chloroflexales bacterium]|nr:DUF389 domain-containing protein [Chloroflexales bacterium]